MPSQRTSVQRAKAATESGAFKTEITPVTVKGRAGESVIAIDEGPGKVKLDKIPSLKPAFKKDGTITAASSSSINDGAAALVLTRESTAKELGAKPIARIVGHVARLRKAPEWFTTAPVGADRTSCSRKIGKRASRTSDCFESQRSVLPWWRSPAMTALGISTKRQRQSANGGAVRTRSSDRRQRRARSRDAAAHAASPKA